MIPCKYATVTIQAPYIQKVHFHNLRL
uniref:Uncharacterized protein n=1 Tax=Rhizophora mucronata TaxID=61149 RepID=A0A2P2M6Q5_RHIMU